MSEAKGSLINGFGEWETTSDPLGIGYTGVLVLILDLDLFFIVTFESFFEKVTLVVLRRAVGDGGDASGGGDSLFGTSDGGCDGRAFGLLSV